MEELYEAVKQCHGDKSFYYTGYLLAHNIDGLQQTWIRLAAEIGFYKQFSFKKWSDTLESIAEFIQSDEISVVDGYFITGKLCMLYQNAVKYISIPKKPLSTLRTKVQDCFEHPGGLTVAPEKLSDILPKPQNERAFCLKVAAGMVYMWQEKNELLREALEYLCRKEYAVEHTLPEFLFGVFKKLSGERGIVAAHILYKAFYKKKDKWRYGLLYGLHACKCESEPWTVNELHILKKLEGLVPELWGEFAHVNKPPPSSQATTKLDILNQFIPYTEETEKDTFQLQEPEEIKKIKVKNK